MGISRGLRRAALVGLAAAVVAAGSASVSAPDDASGLMRYKICTRASWEWCQINEVHSYIEVSTGQNNWMTPGTDYGEWCSRFYNRDTNTHHKYTCSWARWTTACYYGGGSHMEGWGQNGNPGTQRILVQARTASSRISC
jgi:hypothetical protein